MWCEGYEPDCDADQDLCLCGVPRCLVHGHVEEGDDPWCRWLVEDPRARRGWSPDAGAEVRPLMDEIDLSAWEEPEAVRGRGERREPEQVLLQRGRLKIAPALPEAETLQAEWLSCQTKISLPGHDSDGAWRETAHEDVVLAAAVAVWYAEHQVIPRVRSIL